MKSVKELFTTEKGLNDIAYATAWFFIGALSGMFLMIWS